MGMADESWLCTIADYRIEAEANNTVDEDYLIDMIPMVSRELENACKREFEPLPETRTFYPNLITVSPDQRTLTLRTPRGGSGSPADAFLAEMRTVTNGAKTLTVGTDVALHPLGTQPKRKLHLLKYGRWSNIAADCSAADYAVTVEGDWGFRERYEAEGWKLSGAKLQAQLPAASDAATITGRISDPHYSGFSGDAHPRFSVGMLLRIGSGANREFLRVIGVQPAEDDSDPDVLILRRGERGTTPILHNANLDIYIWSVQPELRRACVRWLDLVYARRSTFDTATITDVGIVKHPGDMPSDVKALLWRFLS